MTPESISSTAISVRGNRTFIKAFRELAERKKRPMADLVREAIDEKFAEELKPLVSFFESIDYKNSQLTEKTEIKEAVQP